jgi:aspartyl protease family protein
MDFMVDTGAPGCLAGQRCRQPRDPSAPTVEVKTANGSVHAAATQLGMVEIGGVMVRDVAALVLPDQVLSENLLGMSFLSRLRRFEYGDGKLVLEQ